MGVSEGELPAGLQAFVDAAVAALGPDLRSVVLFGSAAEGRLRATSDVNLILVLRRFDAARADALREPLALAHAGLRLSPMFILESEVPEATVAFANKFMDIERRHRVLHGDDPFASLAIPRPAALARLRQVLLNLVMRLRGRYLAQSRPELRPQTRRQGLHAAARPALVVVEVLQRSGPSTFAPSARVLSRVRTRLTLAR